jgi:N-acetylglucosaminyldiphosphoundecaprenol N-acetyl-beta-D-mannosaminyltransferase
MLQSKMAKSLSFSEVFELPFFRGSKAELFQCLDAHLATSEQSVLSIFTPNPEQVMISKESPDFLAALLQGDILIPDGIGIVIAARLISLFHRLTRPIAEKIGGRELAEALIHAYANKKILVIGGKGYEALSGALKVSQGESLDVFQVPTSAGPVFWCSGYQDVRKPTAQEEEHVRNIIKEVQPKILFVAFGAPYQEYWINANEAFLEKNHVKVAMAVGGAFDVLTGKLRKPHPVMQKIGLEWLDRLFQEPWRWKRQTKLVSFILLTLRNMF